MTIITIHMHKNDGLEKKKIFFFFFFFLYFHIREVLSHSRECGSRATFSGGSRMIREGSHVWYILSKVHIAIQINFADRYSKKEDVRDAICRNFSASVVADSVATIALFQWFVFILNAKLHFGNK